MFTWDLLQQDFRKSLRSQTFYNNLVVKILMGFMALYFGAIFVFLGFSLGNILEKAHPQLNPLELVNGMSLYVVLGALMIRFMMQSLSVIHLQVYQALPIKRNTLVNFVLLKPLFSLSNYVTLLLIVPFALKTVSAWYSGGIALQFILNWVFVIWIDIWLVSYLKRRFGHLQKTLMILLIIVAGVIALEYFKLFSLFELALPIFNWLTITPFAWIATLGGSGLAYMLNRWFFRRNYYPEKFSDRLTHSTERANGNLSVLERYGVVGELIQLQIRLIYRHKRTRSLMFMSLFFMLYGLLFYLNNMSVGGISMLLLCALIITSMVSLSYGQWIMSWESSYFDTILTKNIPTETYIKANYYLLIAFNILSYLLSMPYFLLGTKIIYLHTAVFLYSTGINVFLLVFFATFNNKRIDLMAKSLFNYQGTTYKSFLILLPLMAFPMLFVGAMQLFVSYNTMMLLLGGIGITGIVLMPRLMRLCVRRFNRRKYIMAEGFRQKE